MKKFTYINNLMGFFGVLVLLAMPVSAEQATEAPQNMDEDLKKDLSYFFGYSFGNMLKEGGNPNVDLETLEQGLRDSIDGKQPDLTAEEQQAVISVIRKRQKEIQKQRAEAREQAEAAMAEESEAALKKANAFLEENAEKEGVKTTDSGLQYEILEQGSGPSPDPESTVVVHYEGRLVDGKVFDSSRKRGQPAEFQLNQVIPGWTEGLQLMKEGGKARLYIPPDLGYGPGGTGSIPPNAVLIFDVELLEVK